MIWPLIIWMITSQWIRVEHRGTKLDDFRQKLFPNSKFWRKR